MKLERPPELIEDLKRKQSNLLFEERIANDRDINDVLWNGSERAPVVQRAGAILVGSTFVLLAFCLISILYDRRAWFGMVVPVAVAAAGIRMIYRSFRPKQREQPNKGEHVS